MNTENLRMKNTKQKPCHFVTGFSLWRHHPESNRGIKVLQTSALPLGYGAVKNGADDEARTRYLHLGKVALYQMSYIRKMVPSAGIEPATRGFSVHCSTN